MAEVVLVDGDVLIDIGRNVEEAVACLDQIERRSSPAVSAVTHMELIVGCRNKTELRKLDRFSGRFQAVSLTEAISDRPLQLLRRYRLSHGLLIADAVIAATASHARCRGASEEGGNDRGALEPITVLLNGVSDQGR